MSDFKLVRESEGLQELVYCIAKRGVWSSDAYSRARLIKDSKSFEELKIIVALFQFVRYDELTDEKFDEAVRFLDLTTEIPKLDRMLNWPWDERYEA